MDSTQVKDKPAGVVRMGEKLVFWRDHTGKVICLRDKCAHRGVVLSKGKVIGDHLQCPFHGLEYDHSGKVTVIPANGKSTPVPERFQVLSYPAHEVHGFIWIWWGENPSENLQPPHFFQDIDDSLSFGRIYDHWNAHYSRVIENQLDAAHLPFIHYNTIGRGNRTLVDGPLFQWQDDNMLYVFVHNRLDDGTVPLKPEQMPAPDPVKDFKLEFIFPNLWQNYISEKVRILVAFVPVDQENTILYLRFYQIVTLFLFEYLHYRGSIRLHIAFVLVFDSSSMSLLLMKADIPLPLYDGRVHLPILYTVRRERHYNHRNDLFLFLRNICEYDSL